MKIVYAICGAIGICCAVLCWTGGLEVNATVAGCYAFGWAGMCITEALRG